MRMTRRLGSLGLLVMGLLIAGLWGATTGWAHVTVTAPGVVAGDSDAAIVFRVPDESDTASTVGLKLQLPTDTPIPGVLVAPQPGWTATITQTKLAKPIQTDDGVISEVVSEIDWTADAGAGIKPGFFGQFTIIGGKLPDGVTTLTFKAIQSYSNGNQVAWIERPAPGSTAEPEHPAPTLHLPAASTGSGTGATPAQKATNGASKGAATTGIVLGAVGVALGAAAFVLALRRERGVRSAGRTAERAR
jgi:periplasmic copper chaperone A